MKTRLVIFERDPESGAQSVLDIIEWTGHLCLVDIVKMLPRVARRGDKAPQARAHWNRVLEDLGTRERPFVIEHIDD